MTCFVICATQPISLQNVTQLLIFHKRAPSYSHSSCTRGTIWSKRSMALFRGNTLPHPMKNVSSTVLVDVQSKLSGGSLWAKTMMWLCKVHMILPPLWHSWCQPHQCCMRRKLTSTIYYRECGSLGWRAGHCRICWKGRCMQQNIAYELGDIVQVISPPEVAGSRGQLREIWEVNNASSSGLLLDVPRINLERFGRRAFACAGPTLWNNLPTNLRVNDNHTQFKKLLKT